MNALDTIDNNTALNHTSLIPTTASGKPIEYDGNPAHLAGNLYELEQFLIRTKTFEPFIQLACCLMAKQPDSKETTKFITIGLDVRSFLNMCPDTATLIAELNMAGAAMTTPLGLAWVLTSRRLNGPCDLQSQFALNPSSRSISATRAALSAASC